jgi:hypothetical protein
MEGIYKSSDITGRYVYQIMQDSEERERERVGNVTMSWVQ